jgi:excisionase family DNA binding protein
MNLKVNAVVQAPNDCSLKTEYREWLTSQEAAAYLGVSTAMLMNLTSSGRVPYFKFGRSNRYLVSELRELLMSQPRGERHGN